MKALDRKAIPSTVQMMIEDEYRDGDYVKNIIKNSCITPGEKVLIIGCGVTGISCLKVIKSLGAYVVMLGAYSDETGLEAARHLGADEIIKQSDAENLYVCRGTFDAVFDCASATGELLGISFIRRSGRYFRLHKTS